MTRNCTVIFVALVALFPRIAAAEPVQRSDRVVFVAGEMAEEDRIALTANLAASRHPGLLLIDSPAYSKYIRAFLARFRPEQVVPVGSFPAGVADLAEQFGVPVRPVVDGRKGPSVAFIKAIFPQAREVVVTPAKPRRLVLQAAYLAGVLQAPLFVARGDPGEANRLRRWLATWPIEEIHAVGEARDLCKKMPHVRRLHLPDEQAVAAAALHRLVAAGPVSTLVIANPSDGRNGMAAMSGLAPWLAASRHAALLLTNDDGDNVPAVVAQAFGHPRLRAADNLILMGDLRAIPMERRPNPLKGKDEFIEMEPLTPTGTDPFTFATGRLFHPDPGVVTLMLARQRLLERGTGNFSNEERGTGNGEQGTRKAFVVSNPGGGLPLLEIFSRNTAQELRNCGYETVGRFGSNVSKEETRKLLAEQDIFLWEGHHSTLIKDYGFAEWKEPLPPSFVFLQSCLALAEAKVHPVLQRGAVAVAGSSTRTYSASGGAFSLAFFNAMLYENRPLGGCLRQAKNFLLAYSLLKEKRLGTSAKLTGANLRTAWAFTLWGDPALRLPPPAGSSPRAAVRPIVRGNTIIVDLPDTAYPRLHSGDYRAQMRPNARLAGLLRREPDASKHLVPFVFAEVRLPRVPAGRIPRLHSRLPDKHWVFCWDGRRRVGYLLVTPRRKDERELRFHVEWDDSEAAIRTAAETEAEMTND